MPRERASFWQHLAQFPPVMVRLAARRRNGRFFCFIPREEVAISSNIPLIRIIEISELLEWESVTIGEAQRFCAACRFDPTNPCDRERQREFIRSCKSQNQAPYYLRTSPRWTQEIVPLIFRLKTLKSPTTYSDDLRPSPSHQAMSAA